ncbi:MAG: type I 3-dehydroquinate dehydratase [Candidatus Odinarchaeia archaeon]
MITKTPLICVSIIKDTITGIIKTVKQLNRDVIDLIELRLDYLKNLPDQTELSRLISMDYPKIITLRAKNEGGNWLQDEESRVNTLNNLIEQKPEFIDLEYSIKNVEELINKAHKYGVSVILSKHNFNETPPLTQLKEEFNKMAYLKPDIVKIATMIQSKKDIFTQLKLLEYSQSKSIEITLIGMGAKGRITRLVNPLLGSKIIYCSVLGDSAAPGQLEYTDIIDLIKKFKIN